MAHACTLHHLMFHNPKAIHTTMRILNAHPKMPEKNMPTNAWSHCSQNGEPPKIHKHKPGLVESSGCGFIQNIGYQLPDSVFQPLFDRIYMLAGGMVPITSNISKHSVVSIMFDLKSTRVDSALALGSNQSTWISC